MIFLDQFEVPRGRTRGQPEEMFEPCNSVRRGRKTGSSRLTLLTLAGGGAVTASQLCLKLIGVDKLISRINTSRESVSLGQPAAVTSWGSHRASGVTRAKKFN